MELNKKERLLLINQYKILQKLYPEESEIYVNYQKALEDGFTLNYEWIFESISDEIPVETCREVWDILEMYRAITYSLKNIEDDNMKCSMLAKFRGFDGNNESDLYAYAEYIIMDLDRYNELKYGKSNPELNSHMRMMDIYKKMLTTWNSFDDKYMLNKEQLMQLLNIH